MQNFYDNPPPFILKCLYLIYSYNLSTLCEKWVETFSLFDCISEDLRVLTQIRV
jgi:hypothetical protein